MPQRCWRIQKVMIYWLLSAKKCWNCFPIDMLSSYIFRWNSCGIYLVPCCVVSACCKFLHTITAVHCKIGITITTSGFKLYLWNLHCSCLPTFTSTLEKMLYLYPTFEDHNQCRSQPDWTSHFNNPLTMSLQSPFILCKKTVKEGSLKVLNEKNCYNPNIGSTPYI